MITKVLKDYTFEFDEDKKELTLVHFHYGVNESITFMLPKAQMVSLERFIIRVMAKLTTKRRIQK